VLLLLARTSELQAATAARRSFKYAAGGIDNGLRKAIGEVGEWGVPI
jgi:hypothetical protein